MKVNQPSIKTATIKMTQSTNSTLLKNTNTQILFKKSLRPSERWFSDGLRLVNYIDKVRLMNVAQATAPTLGQSVPLRLRWCANTVRVR